MASNWSYAESLKSCFTWASSVQSLSRVRLFATPWIAARRASVHHQLLEFTQTHVHRVGEQTDQPQAPGFPKFLPLYSLRLGSLRLAS